MEEVEGDLRKLIEKNVFNPNKTNSAILNCLRVALKVTIAIECLYNDKLYYLDLKDDNVFIKCVGFLNEENEQQINCTKGWKKIPYTSGISDGGRNAIKEYQILLGDIGSILFPPVLSSDFIQNNSCTRAGLIYRLPPEVYRNNLDKKWNHNDLEKF